MKQANHQHISFVSYESVQSLQLHDEDRTFLWSHCSLLLLIYDWTIAVWEMSIAKGQLLKVQYFISKQWYILIFS